MGPTILLDKSALQSLSQRELYRLSNHFCFVTCSVLLIEILGDLKKGQEGDGFSTNEVQQLAQKLLGGGYPCADHHKLIAGNLLGHAIPMTGQVPMDGGTERTDKRGRTGIVFGPSPENQAILRWDKQEFSEAEKVLAALWRDATRAIDLEAFQRQHRSKIHNFKNLDNLHRYVSFITHPKEAAEKERQLMAAMADYGLPSEIQRAVFARWMDAGQPDLEAFAPYAYHCLKVDLVFRLGVITGLITTKRTNRIDIQYFYYAPFCQVFCSRDNLHRNLSSTFLRDDQNFVHGDELKTDLKQLNEWWDLLSDDEKREREYEYGSYPPFNDASATHRMWRRHMLPWTPGSGNRAVKMSKEEEQAVLELVNSFDEGTSDPPSTR
jgi:hypothetical protein